MPVAISGGIHPRNQHPTAMSVVASNLELEEKSSNPMRKELPDKRVFFDMGFFISRTHVWGNHY